MVEKSQFLINWHQIFLLKLRLEICHRTFQSNFFILAFYSKWRNQYGERNQFYDSNQLSGKTNRPIGMNFFTKISS